MTLTETLAGLEALGNEKVRHLNYRKGAIKQFGVKLGDLRAIAKKTKTNHPLALELWETENVDARLLALLIIKPKKLSAQELKSMVNSVHTEQVADWLNNYVVKEHPEKESLREEWMNSDNPWAARAGWSLTAGRVTREPEGLDMEALLNRIEAEMPSAPSQAQWTMNSTLAQIGIKNSQYREKALAIGEKLGVYRDYPVSKGCTSPFAPIWINEMVSRQGSI